MSSNKATDKNGNSRDSNDDEDLIEEFGKEKFEDDEEDEDEDDENSEYKGLKFT